MAFTQETYPLPPLIVCSGASHFHAVRTPPDADLVPSLIEAAKQAMSKTSAQSAFVLTAVGSLTEVTLRMAATDKDNDTSHGTVRIQWESQKAYNRQPRPIYHGMDI